MGIRREPRHKYGSTFAKYLKDESGLFCMIMCMWEEQNGINCSTQLKLASNICVLPLDFHLLQSQAEDPYWNQ